MTTPTTPRRLNADVFRRARKNGAPLHLAAYVAAPPMLDLQWLSHYQSDGEWAGFELDGRKFRASYVDPSITEGECVSCAELVNAWRAKDENIAWMTDEEYDRTDHRVLTVTVLDEDGEETGHDATLYGTCGLTDTWLDRIADERYLAEIVVDLAHEAAREAERAETKRREQTEAARNARDAERRTILNSLVGVAVAHGADADDEMRDGFRRELGWTD